MKILKYAVYLAIVVVVALLFEQIMNTLVDLTIRSSQGEFSAYIFLTLIWVGVAIVARIMFTKRKTAQAMQYCKVGAFLHVGVTLAIYFYNVNPLLLLTFPIFLGLIYLMRRGASFSRKARPRLKHVHPHFVDDRGGICVVREHGFVTLKFFSLIPPFPVKELLVYLFRERVECTFEIQKTARQLSYYLSVFTRGRSYDATHRRCLGVANQLRQFLRQERVQFADVNDPLNVLRIYYAPYFLYTPSILDEKGLPLDPPQLSTMENNLIIEQQYEDRTFTIHALSPTYQPNDLYTFLANLKEDYYLQIHLRPLTPQEITDRTLDINQEYRDSLKRLSEGLEYDTEFQAASYLFTTVGQVSKENIEPLLNQNELAHLKQVKQKMHHAKTGARIGLWEVELQLMGNPVLAQALAVKLNGRQQLLVPETITSLVCREFVDQTDIVDSKALFNILPDRCEEYAPLGISDSSTSESLKEEIL